NVCVKIAVAVGSAAIETGPLDAGIDGVTVASCLTRLGVGFIGRHLAAALASAIGHDCAAALIKSGITDVEAAFFDVPQCNEPKGPSGPSDGTPLVVAVLPNVPVTGIPLNPTPVTGIPLNPTPAPGPSTTTSPPSGQPTPSPPAATVPTGDFAVMNADG